MVQVLKCRSSIGISPPSNETKRKFHTKNMHITIQENQNPKELQKSILNPRQQLF